MLLVSFRLFDTRGMLREAYSGHCWGCWRVRSRQSREGKGEGRTWILVTDIMLQYI